MADGKAIQINPAPGIYKKVTDLADKLRTSRGGFCELAVEFVLPKLESGELVQLNGKLVPKEKAAA
jgi:hypothetical protein